MWPELPLERRLEIACRHGACTSTGGGSLAGAPHSRCGGRFVTQPIPAAHLFSRTATRAQTWTPPTHLPALGHCY